MPTMPIMSRGGQGAGSPYNRKFYSRLSAKTSMTIYRRKHIQKLVQMVAKAVGADPQAADSPTGARLSSGAFCREKAAAAAKH